MSGETKVMLVDQSAQQTKVTQSPSLQSPGVPTFPQGILEIVLLLRAVICVLALINVITAAVARANVDDIHLEGERYVDKSALRSMFGYSVAIAVFILIIFVVLVVIRLLGLGVIIDTNTRYTNCISSIYGVINQFWIVFGIMDIVNSFFWAGNSFISTIVSGVGAANARQAKKNCKEDVPMDSQGICDKYKHVSDSGGAAAFFAIATCLVLVILAVHMIIFLILKWNEKHLHTAPANNNTAKSTEPYQRIEHSYI